MPSPAISVAMSVYNGERFLASAIESVLAQDFGDFEFLVLDDGSTDTSAAIIRDLARMDRRIIPIMRENRGLIVSLNQLITAARAPIIARMDADDICKPNRFSHQLAFLRGNPDYGVVGCWTEDIDENGERYPLHGRDHPETHEGFLEAIDNGWPLVCHPAAMMRRDVVLRVGGYHAAFRHCEDYDLWLRLAGITRVGNLPERLLRYRHYENQVSNRHATEQQIGAAVAYLAYRRRARGLADPTASLAVLPPLDQLDSLFEEDGVARAVRARVAPNLLYSRNGLGGDGFDLVCRYLDEGGSRQGMWRAVARLLTFGKPSRAARLAAALAFG